jgi:hypothetical protein
LLNYIVPFCVLLGLSVIGWFSYCICIGFEKQCPPFKSCRRDLIREPFKGSDLYCQIYLILIFASISIAASVYGYIYSQRLSLGYRTVKCSIYALLDELAYGGGAANYTWAGLYGVYPLVSNVTGELDNSVN